MILDYSVFLSAQLMWCHVRSQFAKLYFKSHAEFAQNNTLRRNHDESTNRW